MNRFTTKIGLGIAIPLSSSLLYSHSALAVSLKLSDRKESLILEVEPFFYEEFSSKTSNSLEYNLNIQQEPQNLSYFTDDSFIDDNTPSSLVLLAPEETSDALPDSTLSISIQTEATTVEDLFADSTLNVSIQEETTEAAEIDLLESLTEAIGRLQLESTGNGSLNNVSVLVLPQVAYGDIYRGLYDFEVNLNTPRTPRVVSNLIPNNSLISQESILGYNSEFSGSSSFRTNGINYNAVPDAYQTNLSGGTASTLTNQVSNSNGYENISTRLEGIISDNTTVFTNQEEIENQLRLDYVTPTEKFNSQKDTKSQELERKRELQNSLRERQRKNLEMKLKQQQEQRERRRLQLEETTRRRREHSLRRQTQRQKTTFRRQQTSIRRQQNNTINN